MLVLENYKIGGNRTINMGDGTLQKGKYYYWVNGFVFCFFNYWIVTIITTAVVICYDSYWNHQ